MSIYLTIEDSFCYITRVTVGTNTEVHCGVVMQTIQEIYSLHKRWKHFFFNHFSKWKQLWSNWLQVSTVAQMHKWIQSSWGVYWRKQIACRRYEYRYALRRRTHVWMWLMASMLFAAKYMIACFKLNVMWDGHCNILAPSLVCLYHCATKKPLFRWVDGRKT